MKLCPADKCTGCGACVAACPTGCLNLKEDALGVTRALQGSGCSMCGLCTRICPVLNPVAHHVPKQCYSAWNGDTAERKLSASGGLAALFAKAYAGRAYGTVWDSSFTAVVRNADADKLKGSKYVHSRFDKEVYAEIRGRLEQGEELLFTGTPCQVAGLASYLGDVAEKLLSIDLLCHGTCPSKYLSEELKHISAGRPIDNIRFRGNDAHDFKLSLWEKDTCLYSEPASTQPYFRAYLEGISLRENCYSCPHAIPQRVGDLSLGDFIGLPGQTSMIAVNTPKGERALELLKERFPQLELEEHPYQERFSYRPSILEPTTKSPLRPRFLALYPRLGFSRATRRILRFAILIEKYPLYRKIHHAAHKVKKALVQK